MALRAEFERSIGPVAVSAPGEPASIGRTHCSVSGSPKGDVMPSNPDEAIQPSLDAIELLTNDHQEVADLFEEYQQLCEDDADSQTRQELAEEICTMLSVHAAIEEEIFYPAARDALDDDRIVDEAFIEHQSAKELIAQVQNGDPDSPMYDACVKVLGEYVKHHVNEEEGELFPALREAELDLDALGAQLASRQEQLLEETRDATLE
jgi:hemerythrin-like domain-containing protein